MFADRVGADGTTEASLWNTLRRAANPNTTTFDGETYRYVALDASEITAENEPVVFGVSDAAAASIPVSERTIEMYVHRRVVPQTGNEGAAKVGDFVGYVGWTSGGETLAVPVVAGTSSLHSPLQAMGALSAPMSGKRLNASLAVGVALDEKSSPYCRLASFAVDGDILRGKVEVGREAKGAVEAGTPGVNAAVVLLGARSLADKFEDVGSVAVAADGSFSLAKPEGMAFFKLRLDVVDIVK